MLVDFMFSICCFCKHNIAYFIVSVNTYFRFFKINVDSVNVLCYSTNALWLTLEEWR